MKKTNTLWIMLGLIFLAMFNVVFFVSNGANHKLSVWISYGFIHFAYIMLLTTQLLIREMKSSAVLNFPLYSVSSIYFLVEFVVGVVFILVNPDIYRSALLVQLIIAGFYAIAIISNMIANLKTSNAEKKHLYATIYVKNASAQLKALTDVVNDKETKKKIEKVYDALYSSPVKSHPNLSQAESDILISINELSNAISAGSIEHTIFLADALLVAVNDRNRQLKTLN